MKLQRFEWQDRAACAGRYDVMTPELEGQSIERAKAICASCPVIEDCRKHAIDVNPTAGIWAGVSYEGNEVAEALAHKRRATKTMDREVIYSRGLSDLESAKHANCTEKTWRAWRTRNGLPANRKRNGKCKDVA